MAEKKKIPCRVCGKLFEPCSYCQAHSDVFRWRNFACSRECAAKYINDTITYRESLRHKEENVVSEESADHMELSDKSTVVKRRYNRKISVEAIENKVNDENIETD